MNNLNQTITTVEIAEMMNTSHKSILRKLDGRTENGKHIDGIIEILSRHQLVPVDFFLESTYIDAKGEKRPCYKCTRKGCEFLAHKFQGEKGIQFTAQYINRFHDMEKFTHEKTQTQPLIKQTSNAIIPPPKDWYSINKQLVWDLCRALDMDVNRLYRCILRGVGQIYDLKYAEKLYTQETGLPVFYTMDLISYFEQLSDAATDYCEHLLIAFGD